MDLSIGRSLLIIESDDMRITDNVSYSALETLDVTHPTQMTTLYPAGSTPAHLPTRYLTRPSPLAALAAATILEPAGLVAALRGVSLFEAHMSSMRNTPLAIRHL